MDEKTRDLKKEPLTKEDFEAARKLLTEHSSSSATMFWCIGCDQSSYECNCDDLKELVDALSAKDNLETKGLKPESLSVSITGEWPKDAKCSVCGEETASSVDGEYFCINH